MKAAITLRADMAEFARLEAFVGAFAKRRRLPAAERARLMVILDELFSNVVKYAHDDAGAAAGHVAVALSIRSAVLILEFNDDGPPFDPLAVAAPVLEVPADQRTVGGLGLHIVRNLVDAAAYSRAGGRNRLVLTRQLKWK